MEAQPKRHDASELPLLSGVPIPSSPPKYRYRDEAPRRMNRKIKSAKIHVSRYLRALIFTLFNLEVFLNVGLAMASVYLTSKGHWDIRYRLDTFFLTLAIISPLTAIIAAAFNRRETASRNMAGLHATCVNYYMLHRDWNKPQPGDLSTLADNDAPHATECAELIEDFLAAVKRYMLEFKGGYESHAEFLLSNLNFTNWLNALLRNKVDFRGLTAGNTDEERQEKALVDLQLDEHSKDLFDVYEKFSRLSMWNEKRLVAWGCIKPGADGVSVRTSALLGNMLSFFENLRLVRDYRTPVMLRYGTKVLIYVYTVFLGPTLNNQCDTFEAYERAKLARITKGPPGVPPPLSANIRPAPPPPPLVVNPVQPDACYINYIGAALLLISVTTLARIGFDLEYPFDTKGLDDLFYEGEEDFKAYKEVSPDESFKRYFKAAVDQDKQH